MGEYKDFDFTNLAALAKKGDRHAFASLYELIYKDLFRYAYFTLNSRQDAEDAVSDAVIDAYRSIGKLKNEDAFKAWFFKILSAKCKRKLKEKYKPGVMEEIGQNEIFFSFDQDASIDLEAAVMALSGEERMILSLTVFCGYTSREISKITNINHNTVRTKYSRALVKLKDALTP